MSDRHKAEAMSWAANHLEKWATEMSTVEQRRVAGWIAEQCRLEAEKLSLPKPCNCGLLSKVSITGWTDWQTDVVHTPDICAEP